MDILNTNLALVEVLNEWDPLGYGEGAYETEIADTISAVHYMNDKDKLAKKIQGIYEFSFEEIIPLGECQRMAQLLLNIKNEDSCSI